MKRVLFVATIICSLFLLPLFSLAAPPDYAGGVNDEYEYEEVVFISGEPIKFIGELTTTEKEKTDSKTVDYKFALTPEDKSIKGKLDRKFTYEITYDKRNDKGQTISMEAVKKGYKETITIGTDKYNLEDYQFSRSDIIDNRPASDFYSGTVKAKKTYSINKAEGKVILDISGGDVGYENFWGSTETQMLDCNLETERQVDDGSGNTSTVSWQGTIKINVSDSMAKTMKYAENEAGYSSFSGGHMRISTRKMVSHYEYNLPRMNASASTSTNTAATAATTATTTKTTTKTTTTATAKTTTSAKTPDAVKRNSGTEDFSRDMLPNIERLIIPKFRDTGGHWAEEDINKLYSLDVFSGSTTFFLPDVPMLRRDFTRAVVKATNMRLSSAQKLTTARSRNKVPETSPFQDVASDDADYTFIKEAVSKGLINGVSSQLFMPNEPLTRAQAITIMIRALGFESKAPTPGYSTSFADDNRIPNWSKDCIYVAREIGLVEGDNNNRVNPLQVMTRAEASAMLNRFLDFLQKDLQKDYRDNIILYN